MNEEIRQRIDDSIGLVLGNAPTKEIREMVLKEVKGSKPCQVNSRIRALRKQKGMFKPQPQSWRTAKKETADEQQEEKEKADV